MGQLQPWKSSSGSGVPQNAHEAEVGWFVSYIYDTDGVSPNSKRIPQSNVISDVQN